MRRTLAFALSALALAACKSPSELSIDVTAGQETDAFTADPPVVRVDVEVKSLDGSVDVKASAAPGGTFDLGNVPADQQIGVEVTGVDAAGNTILRGRSLYGLPLDGLDGAVLPVFAQRTGQWARPPGNLVQTHVGGVGAQLGEQYVILTGGAKAAMDGASADTGQVEAYDLLALGGARTASKFARTAETLVSFGSALFLVDSAGATWVDYTVSPPTDSTATAPSGLDFADVAGGGVVMATNGRAFVVGGTRLGKESAAVLEVDAGGSLAAYKLLKPRKGAAAAWIDGVGLVVAGGSAEAPGVEVLADGATAFGSRGFDADPTEGAGAATDGGKGLSLVGGTVNGMAAPTRVLDPACVASCAVKEVAGAALPSATAGVTAYALTGTQLLVVANESGGMGLTRTFLVDLVGSVKELPLKEPRRGAVPVPTALASLALIGGEHPDGTAATSVELFFTQ